MTPMLMTMGIVTLMTPTTQKSEELHLPLHQNLLLERKEKGADMQTRHLLEQEELLLLGLLVPEEMSLILLYHLDQDRREEDMAGLEVGRTGLIPGCEEVLRSRKWEEETDLGVGGGAIQVGAAGAAVGQVGAGVQEGEGDIPPPIPADLLPGTQNHINLLAECLPLGLGHAVLHLLVSQDVVVLKTGETDL